MKKLLFLFVTMLASVSMWADNLYLLKNVETGKYLNAGNNWGMQAVLADDALPVQLNLQGDGSYTIYFPVGSQSQKLLFRDTEQEVYVDYAGQETGCPYWTITDIGGGNYHIQSLTSHPTYGQTAMPDTYLGNNPTLCPNNNVDGNVTNAEGMNITWKLESVPATRTEAQITKLEGLITTAQGLGLSTDDATSALTNENTYIGIFEAIFYLQNRVNEERNRIPECIIIPWGRIQGWEMKYYEPVNGEPDDSWTTENFDDSSWPTLTGPIANEDDFLGVNTNTFWNNEQRGRYYLRRTFELGAVNENGYHFSSRHDDHIKVWINGTEVIDAGFNGREQHHHIPASEFKSGTNTLAILVEDFGGDANLDYSLGNYFFLKNVDANKYLNMGNNWGTQAVLADDALPVQLTKKSDGSYTFYFPYVGERQLLFRDNEQEVYVDYGGQESGCPYWTITHIGSGNYHIQSLTTHPTYGQTAMSGTYLGNNPTLDPDYNVDGNVTDDKNITWTLEPVYARTEAQMTRLGGLITTAQGLGLNTDDEEAKRDNEATTYMEMLATINYLQDRINDDRINRINRINNKVQDLNKLIACANAVGVNTEAAQAVADNPANMEAVTNAISTLRAAYIDALGNGVDASLLPLDVTGAIVNPSFTNDNNAGWTWGENEEPTDMGHHNVEYRKRTFNFRQTISGLPNGYYVLKVKGFHQPGNINTVINDYYTKYENWVTAMLYANNRSMKLKNVAEETRDSQIDGWSGLEVTCNGQTRFVPCNQHDGEVWFANGYYENELTFAVTNGTVTIGVNKGNNYDDDWVVFDDFRLTYLGTEGLKFLKNVETGKYLNAGNDWGTQAVLADEALPVQLNQQGDGSYTIYFPVGSQNQQLLFRDSEQGVFVDYAGQESGCPYWTITDAGEGNYHIQSLTTHPTYGQTAMPDTYLGNNPTLDPNNNVDGNVTNSDGMNITWKLEAAPLIRTVQQLAKLANQLVEAQSLGISTSEEAPLVDNANTPYLDMLAAILSLQKRIDEKVRTNTIIPFADANVKTICVHEWDTNGDGELSVGEAEEVTDLGEVFRGNTEITSFNELQYFKGLTEIGGYAFEGCSNLASVIFPEGLQTIGRYAFHESGLNSISFPSMLTEVGERAFSNCHSLTSIDFSGCSATFNSFCFEGCSMESLYIPNTISIVGMQHFIFCTSLQTVEFQEGYDSYAATMFWHCTNLETVILPTTKVFGWSGWFSECPNINTVTFLDAAENEGYWDYNHQFDLSDPTSCRFVIPEGKAEIFLRKGYMNLSDLSGLPLVVAEFESEAARITDMANTLNSGDKTALSNAISAAGAIVNAAEDYLTVYAQIAAIKSAAKNFLASATLSGNLDVTAAYITNPDFDHFAIGWKLPMIVDLIGYNLANYTNENSQIDHFVQARRGWTLDNGQFSQTITNLPAGIYRLECDAIATWSEDASVEVTGVSLFAGTQTKAMATENDLPQHFTLSFDNPTSKDVNIGVILKNTNANWVAFDNFRLYYEGPAAAAPEGTELVSSEDATYYIYNVGTGMYLNGGNGWGTQAVLAETGLPVRMTQDVDGNWQVYFREGSRNQQLLFKSTDDNEDAFFIDYHDSGNYLWSIISQGDGIYTIQNKADAEAENGLFLGNDPTRLDMDWRQEITLDTHVDVIHTNNLANNTRWQFIKKADYDLYMAKRYLLTTIFRLRNSDANNEAEALLTSAQAVYDNNSSTYDEVVAATTMLNSQIGMPQENQPVDMTALIINPRFENNTSEGWTGAKLTSEGNVQNTQHQTHEFYQTSFNMFQTITGIPNGLYRLRWQGFHRPGNSETVSTDFVNGTNNASAVVYANNVEKTMKHIYTGASDTRLHDSDSYYSDGGKYIPNGQEGARAYFDEGFYADYLEVEVTDNVLTIGVKNTQEMGSWHWVIFSDFELEILQNADQYNNKLLDYAGNGIKGGKAQLPILMNNEGAIAGIQFKIRTPEGITVATDNESNPRVTATSRISGMTLMTSQNEGYTQVLIYGVGKSVKENSGAIVNVALDIANTLDLGDYDVDIYDIVLTKSNGLRIAPFSVKGTVTLVDAQVGDANRDGAVDVADIIAVANKILGHPSAQFDEVAANVNGDSSIDVADIIGIANIILHGNQNLARSMQNEVDMLDPQ